jgi:putative ABC transport system substrate-binding protein
MTATMSSRRRRLVLGAILAAAMGQRSLAAQRVLHLGVFTGGTRDEAMGEMRPALLKELRTLGYVEGVNLQLEWRHTGGDSKLNAPLAAELVRTRPDVLLTEGTQWTRALQRATATIPIVTSVGDPVGGGFASSIARPGGNITGVSSSAPEASAKQIELMRLALPRLAKVTLMVGRNNEAAREITRPLEDAGRAAGIEVETRLVGDFAEVEAGLRSVPAHRGFASLTNFLSEGDARKAIALAIRLRVPTMFIDDEYVRMGGLMSFFAFHADAGRRKLIIVDRVFHGQSPAGIPFELPTNTSLTINRATAAAIGLEIPAELLLRATEVFG